MLTKISFLSSKRVKILRNFKTYVLRLLLIISFFCLSRTFAQIAPADFRCIQVFANTDVKLSWIAPIDQSNSFSTYEIYYSATPNGPFSLVGTQTPISNTTFTHTGSVADIQSCYYFVRTIYGSGSNTVVRNSDTLKTIFLNIINTTGAPNVKLVFNYMTTPNLPSISGPNTIKKEYPMGTWNTLAVTNLLEYSDTISVCQTSLNYQASMLDNSGCISTSNVQGGIFTDTKSPYQPFIDSISVLPNGNVILAWHIPIDEDLVDYVIYHSETNTVTGTVTYPPIDTVNGRNNTAFTFTGTGSNYEAVGLFVAGLDSCGNIGTYDSLPRTMILGVYYDSCKFESKLYWNAYRNMPKGVSEYRVYYSVNGSPYVQVGTSTVPSFIHSGVNPGQSICYYVRAFNKDRSISSSSNKICFYSNQPAAPGYLYMRSATVLKKNSVNINLFLDTAYTCKSVDIFRSEDGLSFKRVGSIPTLTSSPDYFFVDDSAQSSLKSYFYRAVVIDNCGNQRTPSNTSRTMLLKIEEDKEFIFTKRLSWNYYSGFGGGVSGYNIYRVINNETPKEAIASLGLFSDTYSDNLEDEAPNGSKVDYYVEALEGSGNPFGFLENSRSNINPVYMEGNIFIPEAFVPSGVNKVWKPVTHFVDKTEYRVRVYNRWGNKIFETTDDTQGWDGDGAEYGMYVYLISYKNARGEYMELKGTFLLIR